MLRGLALEQSIAHASDQEESQEHSNARAEICESDGRRGEAVVLHKDESKGSVKQVQDSIYESSIHCHKTDNRGVYEHLERPDQSTCDELLVRETSIQGATELLVSSLLLKPFGLASQNDRSVCLATKRGMGDCTHPICYGNDPEGPSGNRNVSTLNIVLTYTRLGRTSNLQQQIDMHLRLGQ